VQAVINSTYSGTRMKQQIPSVPLEMMIRRAAGVSDEK
jgi:hypothetical protein